VAIYKNVRSTVGSRLQGCIGLRNEKFYEGRWGTRCASKQTQYQ